MRCYHADCEQTWSISTRFPDALNCSPTFSTKRLPLSFVLSRQSAIHRGERVRSFLNLIGNAHYTLSRLMPLRSRPLSAPATRHKKHIDRFCSTLAQDFLPQREAPSINAPRCNTAMPSLLRRTTDAYNLPSQGSRTYTHHPPTKPHGDSLAIKRHDDLQSIGVSSESSNT